MHTAPHVLIGTGEHHVIVIHGWLGDARSYEPVWQFLDGERFTYAFMDARGYGAARDAEGDYTIEEIAADIVALADSLGWDRVSLIGHSMGGMAVQAVLRTDAQRVRSIVGVAPVAASGASFDDAAWDIFHGAVENLEHRKQVFSIMSGGRLTSTWIDSVAETSVARLDPAAMEGYLKSHSSLDFHAEISGSTTPVFVVLGEEDPAVTREIVDSSWLKWYQNISVESLKGASHYPMDETPISLVTTIEKFLLTV
jgi:pimeloyl-ACP methyl ester carboxylesterase